MFRAVSFRDHTRNRARWTDSWKEGGSTRDRMFAGRINHRIIIRPAVFRRSFPPCMDHVNHRQNDSSSPDQLTHSLTSRRRLPFKRGRDANRQDPSYPRATPNQRQPSSSFTTKFPVFLVVLFRVSIFGFERKEKKEKKKGRNKGTTRA